MPTSSDHRYDGPEATARAFLSALDAGDWQGTAALVHPQTAERFRDWFVQQLSRDGERVEPRGFIVDTVFPDPCDLVGVRDASEVVALTSTELLARFAAAVDPRAIQRVLRASAPDAGSPEHVEPRVVRTFLACSRQGGDLARAEYRTDWYFAGRHNQTVGGTHAIEFGLSAGAWRVLDADLSGNGTGHIPPPPQG